MVKKPTKKKLKDLDKYLIISISILLVYTIVVLIIFAVTGAEPGVLTGCVFAAFAGEIWACAWIKKLKLQKEKELMNKSDEFEPPSSDTDAFG